MKLTTMTAAAALATAAALPAAADLVFPDLSYRTGPYAAGGIPFSDGYQDYFTLVNERDGGIGGVPARVIECETAYNTEKGVECYEATKGEGALIYQPLSTGITYQLIPKVMADNIPLHTMGYGRTSAANGEVFEWVFNYPANYWDGASVIVNYLLEENGGSLDGKDIALLYHNSAYGKEPIRTLEDLSAIHGFNLTTIAVDHPGQEQKSQWLQIRREQPDYVVMWGWGVMNQVAVQEAANIRFPMENFIGNWWAGAEHDVTPAGEAANGYKSLNMNAVQDYPVFADIRTHVHDKGLAAGDGSNLEPRLGALYPGHVCRHAGGRGGEGGAGDPWDRRHRRHDDARRHGGAGDRLRQDGGAGHGRHRARILGHLFRPWRLGHGPRPAVGCRGR